MLKIVFENQNIIVINKPAGLTVHPTRPEQDNTLVNQLLAYYPEIKDIGEDSLRPGIIHRLDKDTSGLMIIAKNNKSFEYLKKQFQERKVIKKYLALVHGKVKDEKGTITKSISLSKKDHLKRSALLDEKSKPAWTEYIVKKYFNNYTLLEVTPKTGRTHQIRIHLTSIGYPITGDKQYKFKRQINPKNLNRQFLHASYLKFKLPDGKIAEFKSKLPQDLEEVLESIK
ncbi:MAG: RluA family pseudouridine synthase [Candidatus Portnoybacteria bacterium]|nr:RluA family pseudouridine synthase [Candidatus Portnoybacteria bacterium]